MKNFCILNRKKVFAYLLILRQPPLCCRCKLVVEVVVVVPQVEVEVEVEVVVDLVPEQQVVVVEMVEVLGLVVAVVVLDNPIIE